MAIDYKVKLIDRANESNYHEFTKGVDISDLTWGYTKPGGCAAFSFTAAPDSWGSIDSLMEPENLVEIYVSFGGGGLSRCYTGIVQKVDGAGCTPPRHLARTVSGFGLVAELRDLLVLAVYNNTTVQNMVKDLISTRLAVDTDIVDYTASVTTGSSLTIARSVFEDKKASDVITKLAHVLSGGVGDVVWGVDHNRRLVFHDESGTNFATIAQGDGITVQRHEIQKPGFNKYIIAGRTAVHGIPMTIEVDDVAAGDRVRSTRVRAPELIAGANMQAWGQYLAARDGDAKHVATVTYAGVEDLLSGPITLHNGGYLTLSDTGEPAMNIKAVTYTLNGGEFDAVFELGDYEPDPAAELRDLLRDTAVLDLSEFSNHVEIQSDGTDVPKEMYYVFVGQDGMRNNVCLDVDRDLQWIDFDSSHTVNVEYDSTRKALVSTAGPDSYGTFATKAIPTGLRYDVFAGLRECSYPVLFSQNIEADMETFTPEVGALGVAGHYWRSITEPGGSTPKRKVVNSFASAADVNARGCFIRNAAISDCDYIVRFQMGTWYPIGSSNPEDRFVIFRWKDQSNYAYINFTRMSDTRFLCYPMKRLSGTNPSGISMLHPLPQVDFDPLDICRITIDTRTSSYQWGTGRFRFKIVNETQDVEYDWCSADFGELDALEALNAARVGFGSYISNMSGGGGVESRWYIHEVTFDNAIEAGQTPNWQISRDGGDTFEDQLMVDSWTGDESVNFGAYSGGGTQEATVIVKGTVTSPQQLTHFGVGWKPDTS